ncbi:SCO family protein [Bacillus sp. FJAT-45037]|uniref:SCO family protein n=1 Tax=Bacillus sp. FJAT-45037 TaxID=2011007 RepID=UPI000C23C4EE|nr:SCO family protein [Bacillus sp. FJAT-45037]
MRKLRCVIFSMLLIGLFLIYWLWPDNETLPILDSVNAFQLEEVHGENYKSDNGKVKVITFFFTQCPDICPLTMIDFRDLQTQLKDNGLFGDQVELVAVSLDPENDLPETIKNYADTFQADPYGWKWLRGTPEETKQIAKELQMQYEIEDGVVMYHSITMYLVDSNNNIRALYDMATSNNPVNKDEILEDINVLVQGN